MERLRRKIFKSKKSIKSTMSDSSRRINDDDEIYLEPDYDRTSNIAIHIDAIADELFRIAKTSSYKTELSKLHDELLIVKTMIIRKLNENSRDIYNANKQIDLLQRPINKQILETDSNMSILKHNQSFPSDHSMADSTSYLSVRSPNTSILSSSVTTPTFRRRLAETNTSNMNYSSVIQEHFVYLHQQLCLNCSKCSCYQKFIRNQIELEYLSICSYNERLKCENDLLQRLLADCKYSYEQQYVLFSQYEQYLIEYEQCIKFQYELIQTFQQLLDRFQILLDKRKRDDDNHENHIYQKINDITPRGPSHDSENMEIYRMISYLNEQCQLHLSKLPKRAQLFSYSQERFHPPPNISGIVDIADLETSILLVDLLTLQHENSELRWSNNRLLREKKAYKAKIDLYELTNKYLTSKSDNQISLDNTQNELIEREKTLRLYVYRLYDLLQTTSKQLKEQKIYYENLVYQFKMRNKDLTEYIQRTKKKTK